ncbi:hypothetical protein GCM10011501_27780 [Thalassotalea profundi]|uniref:Uncharacterized protein n=2 Tax=Thalassotalea profundi TaxID=2036687 RepID=A0ABQ3IXQ4_9GAMM|nr:hypothetical protein GCM10011501_27780 [Thalassotalea profundi]
MLKISHLEHNLLVQIPYMPKVNAALKRIGKAEYSYQLEGWVMQTEFEDLIRAKLIHYFGACDDVSAEKVDVVITFKRTVEVRKRPVSIAGRIFARAHGRDTGASTGDGIALLDGDITSGGSNANWTSVVESGAKFRVNGLYARLVTEFENKPDQFDIELLTDIEEFNPLIKFLPDLSDECLIKECAKRGIQIP